MTLRHLFLSCLLLVLVNFAEADNFKFTLYLTEDHGQEQKFVNFNTDMTCGNQDCEYSIVSSNQGFYKVLVNGKECFSNICNASFNRHQTVNVTVQKDPDTFIRLFDFEFEVTPKIRILGCDSGFYNTQACTKIEQETTNLDTGDSFKDTVCVCVFDDQKQQAYCDDSATLGTCQVGDVSWWHTYSDMYSSSSTLSTPSPITWTYVIDNVTVSLNESLTNAAPSDYNQIIVSAYLNCTSQGCHYKSTVTNYGANYYTFSVGDGCTQPTCAGSILEGQSATINIYRKNQKLKVLAYQWKDKGPEIVVLGCDSGLLLTDTCLKSYNNPLVDEKYYNDVVCSCQGSKMGCDNSTPVSVCIGGVLTWWSDEMVRSTFPTTTSIATTTIPPEDPFKFDVSFYLSEGVMNGNPKNENNVTILANMNCTDATCNYSVRVVEYEQTYYTISVNGQECPGSHCQGLFTKHTSIPIHVTRVSEVVNLFDLEYIDSPNIKVLGCTYGMLNYGACTKAQYYDDVIQKDDTLCICRSHKSECDASTDSGTCSDGDPVWWKSIYDLTTSPTTTGISSTSTLSRTTSSTFVTVFTFRLSESTDVETKEISIETSLRCSDSSCTFDMEITNNAMDYFSVSYDDEPCVNSCHDSFLNTQTIHVNIYRLGGDRLEAFELKFKQVVVLNCTRGWLEEGKCLRALNGKDDVCTCQDADVSCGSAGETSACLEGTPVWWQPDPLHTSTLTSTLPSTSVSTTKGPFSTSFDISLYETTDEGTQTISIHTTLKCTDTMCSYKITVTKSGLVYFSVYIDNKDCPETCESSFNSGDTVSVYIEKLGGQQRIDLFDMKFEKVVVLGCYSGWLVSGKCVKAKNGADEMCSCQDTENYCGQLTDYTACTSGDPVWWQPNPAYTPPTSSPKPPSSQYSTVSVTLSEAPTNEQTALKTVNMIAAMNCSRDHCEYATTVKNQNPEYYTVLRNGEECPAPCHGTLAHGDPSIILSVHRLEQHLDFVEFQFTDAPKIMVMGCEAMIEEGSGLDEEDYDYGDDTKCVHIFEGTTTGGRTYHDDVCLCRESGLSCEDGVPVGKCSSGTVTWWQNDFSTSTSTVTSTTIPTTTVTTTTPTTTTVTTPTTTTVSTTSPYDQRNLFAFEISLAEGRNNKKNQVIFSTEMTCESRKCDFSIKVDNSAQTWFKVYVGSDECQNKKCSGSFSIGHGVNVTVYRGVEMLDLFDFEYTDVPRIVVLGCENGFADYGSCTRITKAVKVAGQDFVDEICSCRSEKLDCKLGKEGVCRGGSLNWWREAPITTTTDASTTSETTTVTPTTTSPVVPSLPDLANGGVDLNNVTQVLNDTEHYSKQGPNLNRTQIFDITKILHNSANLPGISRENAIQILQNMDQCLNAHREQIRRGQSKEYRLLSILRPMVMNTKDTVIQYLDGKNLGFNAKKVNCNSENHYDDGLIDYGRNIGFAPLNDTNRISSTHRNSIIVPLGEFCNDNQEISHVFFTIFRGQKLFRGTQAYRSYGKRSESESDTVDDTSEDHEEFRQRWKRDANQNGTDNVPQIPAPSRCITQVSIPDVAVMSASVVSNRGGIFSNYHKIMSTSSGQRTAKPATMARLQFNTGNMLRPLHGSKIVTWFDTARQEWALQEQCKMESDENGVVTASCEHLTDFTVLIHGQLDAEQVCSWPLIIVGYSVNGASIFCLLLLIVIGLMFYIQTDAIRRILSYVRGQAQTSGDIINLSYYCIFLMFFVLSLFFMDQSSGGNEEDGTTTYCVVIAAMSYFSLISAIMMSMLIGIRMICHFFSPKLRAFFGVMTSPPAALSIGIIIPFCLTLLLALLNTEFFERNDAFCWVRPDFIAYAVVIPVILPIINGVICSSFAIYKMFFQAKRGLKSKETSHYDAEFWSKVLGLIIMQFAMGLPWGIEFILIGVAGSSAWNYVFVILLGTQGIDLFLIFLYRRQRLVNESRKWSAREEKLERKSRARTRHATDRDLEET